MISPLPFLRGLLVSLFLVALVGCQVPLDDVPSWSPDSEPLAESPGPWLEWAQWVENQRSVGDGQGHGPDVGSDEWAWALDHQLGISDGAGHGPDIGSSEWRASVEGKLRP